jgi:transcriptional regulator with XRE-family HTH domain
METHHPLLAVLGQLAALPPRSRRLLRALLVEVDDANPSAPTEEMPAAAFAGSEDADRRLDRGGGSVVDPPAITNSSATHAAKTRRARSKVAVKAATPDLAWVELRSALLAEIRRRGMTHKTAAEAIGLEPGSLSRLLRQTRMPSAESLAKIRKWLAAVPATSSAPDASGAARLSSPPYGLSETQRSKLGLLLEVDPGVIRQVASQALAQKAIDGQSLDPAVVARLAEVVDRPQGNGAATE